MDDIKIYIYNTCMALNVVCRRPFHPVLASPNLLLENLSPWPGQMRGGCVCVAGGPNVNLYIDFRSNMVGIHQTSHFEPLTNHRPLLSK